MHRRHLDCTQLLTLEQIRRAADVSDEAAAPVTIVTDEQLEI